MFLQRGKGHQRRRTACQPRFSQLHQHWCCSSRDPPRTWFASQHQNPIERVHLYSGAVHEHSRPDRDLFITILYENIQPDARHNFDKVDGDNHNARNTPFDTSSLMMYGAFDFGIDGTSGPKITIQPLEAGTDIRQEFVHFYL